MTLQYVSIVTTFLGNRSGFAISSNIKSMQWAPQPDKDMIKRTGKNITDPISLENIDILDEWICEEPNLLTIDDVRGWICVEQPNQDGGEEEGPGPVTREELGVEDDDAIKDDDANVAV
eukprot:TRINITY_DN37788_c0_g1_i1.p2 TRINITY_DN37788_c0_g1~~TRINITY_DN37788_c0_g1_i1.p2  ORF type:complete len:119 (-),score=29.93 TRINITY_DN37788_c0_g1_i1:87-443(-)